jgi:hypothetical protein
MSEDLVADPIQLGQTAKRMDSTNTVLRHPGQTPKLRPTTREDPAQMATPGRDRKAKGSKVLNDQDSLATFEKAKLAKASGVKLKGLKPEKAKITWLPYQVE